MALTDKEAFKIGYLYACKKAGLSNEQISEMLEKQATPVGSFTAGLAGAAVPTLATIAAIPVLGGNAIGRAVGAMAHNASNTAPDQQDVMAQERADKYRELAEQIRANIEAQKRIKGE